MKHIFIIAEPLDHQRAGIHQYTYQLINELEKQRDQLPFEITLIRSGKTIRDFNLKTIQIPNLNWIPGWRFLKLFLIIPLICIFKGADIVFEPAHMGPFNLPKRIKRVTMIHDLTPILFPQWHRPWSAKIQKWFLPGIIKKADFLITNSKNTTNDLINAYPIAKGKTQHIYLGVSDKFFPRELNQKILDKYGITLPFILYVGTIEPRKNLISLIDAFQKLKANNSLKHQLVVAGKKGWKSEPFYKSLEKNIFNEEIVLPGFIDEDDLPQLYSSADLLVYPSLYEGFGLPVVEAIACGTKVLVAKNSSLKEITSQEQQYEKLDNFENLIFRKIHMKDNPEEMDNLIDKKYSWNEYVKAFAKCMANIED